MFFVCFFFVMKTLLNTNPFLNIFNEVGAVKTNRQKQENIDEDQAWKKTYHCKKLFRVVEEF